MTHNYVVGAMLKYETTYYQKKNSPQSVRLASAQQPHSTTVTFVRCDVIALTTVCVAPARATSRQVSSVEVLEIMEFKYHFIVSNSNLFELVHFSLV